MLLQVITNDVIVTDFFISCGTCVREKCSIHLYFFQSKVIKYNVHISVMLSRLNIYERKSKFGQSNAAENRSEGKFSL
jgi:hypothetical protein